MSVLVGLHYLTAFVLELAMVFALGRFGYLSLGGGFVGGLAALALAVIGMGLWFWFASPKAPARLQPVPLFAFKFAILSVAAVAYWATGWPEFAMVFGAVAVLDLGLGAALGRI